MINREARLQRLEDQLLLADAAPLRILVTFVKPVTHETTSAFAEGQWFRRLTGESSDELCARAHAALGWASA
jgi:hypothetical protein